MQIGLHVSKFQWPDGPANLATDLVRVATAAEEAGFRALSVMDHLFAVPWNGEVEDSMLEAYTTLGFLAASTKRMNLLAMVTATTFREPGLLAKAVTTLDVLSKGRAWLGIGAGFYEAETTGLGLPLPSVSERFERMEETLQIVLQMWSESEDPYQGQHYQLGRTLNSPQALTRPHPPILIGGGGEKKTLRLVAQYAQKCNLFGSPELEHKLAVLRTHCDEVGRNFDDIEKTVGAQLDPGPNGENVETILEQLRAWSALGVTHVQTAIPNVASLTSIEIFAERIIPVARDVGHHGLGETGSRFRRLHNDEVPELRVLWIRRSCAGPDQFFNQFIGYRLVS